MNGMNELGVGGELRNGQSLRLEALDSMEQLVRRGNVGALLCEMTALASMNGILPRLELFDSQE